MSVKHYDVVLGAGATQVTSTANRVPVRQMFIENSPGNGVVKVGDSTLASDSYGRSLGGGDFLEIGPFQGAPFSTDNVYLLGTQGQTVRVLVVEN